MLGSILEEVSNDIGVIVVGSPMEGSHSDYTGPDVEIDTVLHKDLHNLKSFCLRAPAAAGHPFRIEIALEACSEEGYVPIAVRLVKINLLTLFLPFPAISSFSLNDAPPRNN